MITVAIARYLDKARVSKAVILIQRRYGRVGFPYTFDQRERKAIESRPRCRKRQRADATSMETVDTRNTSINTSTITVPLTSTPPTTENSQSQPAIKRQRVSHNHNHNNSNSNNKRFMWTQGRKRIVTDESILVQMFAKPPDQHDELCIKIHNECCFIDPAFEKVDPSDVKKALYAIQRKAAGVTEDRVKTLKSFEKAMRDHLSLHGVLKDAFYIHDSASYVY